MEYLLDQKLVNPATTEQVPPLKKFFSDKTNWSFQNFDKKEKFYIGIADTRDNDRKSFRGFVSDFAYWNKALQKNEIQELTETFGLSYITDTGQYSSSENLKIYYDFKHIQLNQPYND